MSVRIEWHGAAITARGDIAILGPGEPAPDGQCAEGEGNHVLLIGAAAYEGTLPELNALSIAIRTAVIRKLTGSRRG